MRKHTEGVVAVPVADAFENAQARAPLPYNNGLAGFRPHTQNAIDPMTFQTTLYDLLEVSPYASVRVIRAAYRCLAQCSHPDKHAGALEAMAQQSRFNDAYAVLSDPVRRVRYDQSIRLPARFQERRGGAGGVWQRGLLCLRRAG